MKTLATKPQRVNPTPNRNPLRSACRNGETELEFLTDRRTFSSNGMVGALSAMESRMSRQGNATELAERLAIVERALAEVTTRVGELTSAVADIAQLTGPSDPSGTQPINIGADDISPFAVGFYQREYDSSDRAYRWTGKGSFFELRIRLNRNFEWSFTMELQRNRHVNISGLRGYVDYIEIPIQANEADGYIRGIVPSRPLGSSAILTFQLPNLFVPNQINPESPDNRTLGVVFYEIRAVPDFDSRSIEVIALSGNPGAQAASTGKSRVASGPNAAFGGGSAPENLPKSRRSLAASVSRLKISI